MEGEREARDLLAPTAVENPGEERSPEQLYKTIEREKEIDPGEKKHDLELVLDPERPQGGHCPGAELAPGVGHVNADTTIGAITAAGAALGVESANATGRGIDETPIGPEDGLDHGRDRELDLDRAAVVRDGDIEQVVYFNNFIIHIFMMRKW